MWCIKRKKSTKLMILLQVAAVEAVSNTMDLATN